MTYKFRVEAKNSFDFSAYSSTVSIICATIPTPPSVISTSNSGSNVIITWNAANGNGLPILAYHIYIENYDG